MSEVAPAPSEVYQAHHEDGYSEGIFSVSRKELMVFAALTVSLATGMSNLIAYDISPESYKPDNKTTQINKIPRSIEETNIPNILAALREQVATIEGCTDTLAAEIDQRGQAAEKKITTWSGARKIIPAITPAVYDKEQGRYTPRELMTICQKPSATPTQSQQ